MRKYIILFISIFLAFGCYKDTDFTHLTKTEREPRIIVSGTLVGNYISTTTDSNAQFSIRINNENYLDEDYRISLFELEGIEKKGQFLEFFENGIRTGAAQIPFIENEINYTELSGTSPFTQVEFSKELILNDKLKVDFVNAEFIDKDLKIISENLKLNYQYTEDSEYLSHLISFAYGETGNVEIVNSKSSFYLGTQHGNNELAMSEGEIILNYSGDLGQSLYYFNEEESSWEWVSKFVQEVNSEKIVRTGWYAIGESSAAKLIKGHVESDNLKVVKQQIRFVSDQFATKVVTSGTGKFECYVHENGSVKVELVSGLEKLIYEENLKNEPGPFQFKIPESALKNQFLKSDFKVLNCDGSLTAKKNITLSYNVGDKDVIYLENEDVSYIPVNDSNFMISSGDGPKIDWATDKGEIHYLSNCSTMQNGFTFMKIRSDQKIYPAFQVEKLGERTYLEDDANRFKFIVETSTKGNLATEKINISVDDDSFGESGYFVSCEQAPSGCGIEVCEITHYKEDGDEWNRIYFKGKIWMQTIDPAKAGNFNVEGYILSKR